MQDAEVVGLFLSHTQPVLVKRLGHVAETPNCIQP